MFESLDARPLELRVFDSQKKRGFAFWAASCWRILALGEAAFLEVRLLSSGHAPGSWRIALGMVTLVFYRAVSFRERARLETQMALTQEEGRQNPLSFAYRSLVRRVAVACVACFIQLVGLKWIVFSA